MKTVLLPILLIIYLVQNEVAGMFKDVTDKLIPSGTPVQRNYGVAVSNIGEGEGPMEWIIAGYSGPNIVLQMDTKSGVYKNVARKGTKYESLMDPEGNAIGVSACDIDGDGKEEIYFLNTNNRYSGRKLVTDRLFTWRNNHYENLFEDEVNKNVLSMFSGRSVACIDRTGNGKYGILLATYAEMGNGKFELIEVDETRTRGKQIVLHSIAESVGINFTTGGRGIVVGPVLGDDGFSDIYFVNEGNWRLQNRGDNAFYKNDGFGRFTNIAPHLGLDDLEPGRGVTLADFNNDELIDIAYGNWNSRHKMLLQRKNHAGKSNFYNVATPEFATASYIRTVIAADFDNDGNTEVLFNNIVYRGDASNKLFKVIPNGRGVSMTSVDIGDAREQDKYGTGAAVADIDDDGVLELLISHGESASQPLTLYHVKRSVANNNNFIRIMPTTQNGAPARGSKVTLTLTDGTKLSRIIDGGSGYLCQMEPVAHFGLRHLFPEEVRIQWPDGHHHSISLTSKSMNKMHIVSFNGDIRSHGQRRSETVYHYHPESMEEEIKAAEDSSTKVSQKNRIQRPLLQRRRWRQRNNRNRSRLRYSGRRKPNIQKPTSIETSRLRSDSNTNSQRRHFTRSNSRSLSSRSETAYKRSYGKSPTKTKSGHSRRTNAHTRLQHPQSSELYNQRTRYTSSRKENTRSQNRYSSRTQLFRRRNPTPEDSRSHYKHSARINHHSLLSRHSTAKDTNSQPRHPSGVEPLDPKIKHSRPEDTGSQPGHPTNTNKHFNPGTKHNLSAKDTQSKQRHSSNANQRYNPGTRHNLSVKDIRSQPRHSINANRHHNSDKRHNLSAQDTRSQQRRSNDANQRYNPVTRQNLSVKDTHSQRRHSTNANQLYNPGTRYNLRADDTHSQPRHSTNADQRYNPGTRHNLSAKDSPSQQRHSAHTNHRNNPGTGHLRAEDTRFQRKHPANANLHNSRTRHSSADDNRSPRRHLTHATKHKYNFRSRHTTRKETRSWPKHLTRSRVEPYSSETRHSTEKSSARRKQSYRTEAPFVQTDFSTRERSKGPSLNRTNDFNPNSRYSTRVNIGSHGRQSTKVDATQSRSSKRRYPSPQHKYRTRLEPYNTLLRQSRGELPNPVTKTTFFKPRLYPTTQYTPAAQNRRSHSRQITTRTHLRLSSSKGHERKNPAHPRRDYHHTRHSSNRYSRHGPHQNVTLGDHSSKDRHGRRLEPTSNSRRTKWVAHVSNRRKYSTAGLQPMATQHPSLYKTHSSRLLAQGSLSSRRTRTRLEPSRASPQRQTSISSRRHGARNKTRLSSYKMPKYSRHNSLFGHSAYHHAYPTGSSQQIHHRKLSSEADHHKMSSSTKINTNTRSQPKSRAFSSKNDNASQPHQAKYWTRSRVNRNAHYRLRYKKS